MRTRIVIVAVLAASVVATGLRAQTGCGATTDPASCYAVEQALHSAVPQVGIAAAGGNPLPGTASVGGVRLGFLPRVTADLRASAARMRLPDLGSVDVAGNAAVSLTQGLPGGMPGLGSLDLLLSAGVIPGGGLRDGASTTYGAGVRLGILRETFGTPAVNVSAMYRRVAGMRYGAVCGGDPAGLCVPGSGGGQLEFAVRDVSLRATVGGRAGRIGLVGGAGYDRFSGGDSRFSALNGATELELTQDEDVSEGRLSMFAELSVPLTVGAVTLEGGWMRGGGRVANYPSSAAYDPGSGTIFGGLSLRLSL
jgi:hypothetical protein